jgi:hypothetical protein
VVENGASVISTQLSAFLDNLQVPQKSGKSCRATGKERLPTANTGRNTIHNMLFSKETTCWHDLCKVTAGNVKLLEIGFLNYGKYITHCSVQAGGIAPLNGRHRQ